MFPPVLNMLWKPFIITALSEVFFLQLDVFVAVILGVVQAMILFQRRVLRLSLLSLILKLVRLKYRFGQVL